jgi:hypothetical protein
MLKPPKSGKEAHNCKQKAFNSEQRWAKFYSTAWNIIFHGLEHSRVHSEKQ